jgi:hypothetical protein
MSFSTSTYFAGVGTVVGALALGFGSGIVPDKHGRVEEHHFNLFENLNAPLRIVRVTWRRFIAETD